MGSNDLLALGHSSKFSRWMWINHKMSQNIMLSVVTSKHIGKFLPSTKVNTFVYLSVLLCRSFIYPLRTFILSFLPYLFTISFIYRSVVMVSVLLPASLLCHNSWAHVSKNIPFCENRAIIIHTHWVHLYVFSKIHWYAPAWAKHKHITYTLTVIAGALLSALM